MSAGQEIRKAFGYTGYGLKEALNAVQMGAIVLAALIAVDFLYSLRA